MKIKVSRRGFLKSAAIAASLMASAPLLEACQPEETGKSLPPRSTRSDPVPKEITPLPTPPTAEAEATKTVLAPFGVGAQPGVPALSVGEVEIEVYTTREEGSKGYELIQQEFIPPFETEHPGVKVKLISGGEGSREALMKRLQEGNPPEVMPIASPANPTVCQRLWEAGQIYDMTPIMYQPAYVHADRSTADIYVKAVADLMRWQGRWIMVPQHIYLHSILIFHEDYFRRHFLPRPTDWGQTLMAMERLKKHGVTPIAGHRDNVTWWWEELALRLAGPKGVKDAWFNTGPGFKENPKFLEAAKGVRFLLDRGYFADGWYDQSERDALIKLGNGDAVVVLGGSWMVRRLPEFPPEFKEFVVVFPSIYEGKGSIRDAYGHIDGLNVAAKSQYPALGAEWLRFWSSDVVQHQREKTLEEGIPFTTIAKGYSSWVATNHLEDILWRLRGLYERNMSIAFYEPELVGDQYKAIARRFMLGETSAVQFIDELEEHVQGYYAQKKG